jgi:hypothetical protein
MQVGLSELPCYNGGPDFVAKPVVDLNYNTISICLRCEYVLLLILLISSNV